MRTAQRALLALVAAGVAAACGDNVRSHVYAAAAYDQTNGCTNPYAAIDVVAGDDPGSQCAPVCLANGGAYYVSTMCPPYPALFVVTQGGGVDAGVDPVCTAALAAYTGGKRCGADGGVEGGAGDGGVSDGAMAD